MTHEIDGRNPFDVEGEDDFNDLPANPEPAKDEKPAPGFDVEDEHDFDDLPGTGGEQSDDESDAESPANE